MQDNCPHRVDEINGDHAPVDSFDGPSASNDRAYVKQSEPSAGKERQAKQQRRKRSTPSKPDFWVSRKWAILIVAALACWSFYVVVGKMCTPMIRQQSTSGLGLSVGVGALVGFVIVWLLMIWTYLKMVITGPGMAPQHVPKSTPPGPSDYRLDNLSPPPIPSVPTTFAAEERDPSEFAPIGNLIHETLTTHRVSSDSGTEAPLKGSKVKDWRTIDRPLPPLPPPVRWCQYCEITKPPRTHHCRHCGVCILQFDHHCLWIGQCVGFANHKVGPAIVVAIIILSALFGLFTFAMCLSHVHLIVTGRTTVESFASRDQHEAESRILQQEYGYFFHNNERRKVQKKWKEEWGNTPVDARWVFGTKLEMWEQEMGKSRLGWILPIGKPLGDGIHYENNPRFGPNGEWLKKKDWPKDLQT
ncbi:uncharacterized protein I206_102093 [Kwoniella pini CBS 10737]|uniref:Palmitoyltransferase n=1 Tax=Kwoniella pini CBS 10737 TaxID=1296096 RepID=A0AAJ8L2W8_9TREE